MSYSFCSWLFSSKVAEFVKCFPTASQVKDQTKKGSSFWLNLWDNERIKNTNSNILQHPKHLFILAVTLKNELEKSSGLMQRLLTHQHIGRSRSKKGTSKHAF